MNTYSNLLEELKLKIIELQKPIIVTAREYIPKLYAAFLNENPNLTPIEAKHKILQDCRKEFWSKRTILAALPDEAKNLQKQQAGRQRYKNQNLKSAAITAAPIEKQKSILDANEGKTNSNELEELINENFELKQIIRQNTELKTAYNIKVEYRIFTVPKEKFPLFIATIEKSREHFQLKFDKEVLVDVLADTMDENYK